MMGHRYQTVTWDKMEVGQLTFRISMGAYIGYVGRATCSTAKVLPRCEWLKAAGWQGSLEHEKLSRVDDPNI